MSITLDGDTADRITLLNLTEHRSYLQEQLTQHAAGQWLHPEDAQRYSQYIQSMNYIIAYYGGELENKTAA